MGRTHFVLVALSGLVTAGCGLQSYRLHQAAYHLNEQGRFAEAIPKAREAVAIRERELGPIHPWLATSLNNLAFALRGTGNYAEARVLHERALKIREQALGPTHPDVATSLNNLALVYYTTGDYGRAEPLYQRALAIREKARRAARYRTGPR